MTRTAGRDPEATPCPAGAAAARAPEAPRSLAALHAALRAEIAPLGSAAVAFSGGVDSTLVLALATEVLGARALGVVGVSPSLAPAETADARRLAGALGARIVFVASGQMDDPAYVANDARRCFHCKTDIYAACRAVAAEHDLAAILNGTNADDPGDVRPGLAAAEQASVRSPLLACGMRKDDVRRLARHLGLPNWDKPANACLASRLPHGTSVTTARLAAVDAVEQELRALGFRQVRARHHGDIVRLEVEPGRVDELRALSDDPRLMQAIRAAGFLSAQIAGDGYRTGRLSRLESATPALDQAEEGP